MKKALGLMSAHVLLAVVCAIAIAGIPEPLTLRLTNVPTNGTYSSAVITRTEGWLDSITIWPDTLGGTFTGSVAIVLIETNGASGLGNEIVLYSNDTVIAKTTIQPRRQVHQVASGIATNTATMLARYVITPDMTLSLRAINTVLASNKNVSAFIVLDR